MRPPPPPPPTSPPSQCAHARRSHTQLVGGSCCQINRCIACWLLAHRSPPIAPHRTGKSKSNEPLASDSLTNKSYVRLSPCRYASTAFASRSITNFKSAVIIHASSLAQQMGSREFPILWTTGTKDPLYGPGPASVRTANHPFPLSLRLTVTAASVVVGPEFTDSCSTFPNCFTL